MRFSSYTVNWLIRLLILVLISHWTHYCPLVIALCFRSYDCCLKWLSSLFHHLSIKLWWAPWRAHISLWHLECVDQWALSNILLKIILIMTNLPIIYIEFLTKLQMRNLIHKKEKMRSLNDKKKTFGQSALHPPHWSILMSCGSWNVSHGSLYSTILCQMP